MKIALATMACALVAGCAGMTTQWVFSLQSTYQTPQDPVVAPVPVKPASSSL